MRIAPRSRIFAKKRYACAQNSSSFILPNKLPPEAPALAARDTLAYQGEKGHDMRILITNDDGINAPGLTVLHAIARIRVNIFIVFCHFTLLV